MSLKKEFFKYAIPSVISMWMFSIYTMVDGMFVAAGVGPMVLAGVNISMPFVNFILGVSLLFSTGAAAVVSMKIGRGEEKEAKETFMTILFTITGIGILIALLGHIFLEPLMDFLGATPNIREYVRGYLGTVLKFAPVQMLAYYFEVMSRADGFPKIATASVAISGIMNIILDYIFVMKFHWGVEGAALATGIAQCMSLIFLIAHTILKGKKLRFAKFEFNLEEVITSAKLGFADSITEFSVGIVVFLFNHRILQIIGEEGVVSYTIIAYVNTLVLMTMSGLSQGMLPLVSYYYGKEEEESVNELLKIALKAAVFCSVAWFGLSELFAGTLVSFFINKIDDPILFSQTVINFRIYAIAFLFMGVNVVVSTWFSAVEKPKNAVIISLLRGLVLIALMLYLLSSIFGATGIWLSPSVSEFTAMMVTIVLFNSYQKEREKEMEEEGWIAGQ